jgi:ABC-2 type transport system permease protein
MSWLRVKAVMRKEFIHVFRDKGNLRLVFMLPLVMMFILGFVATTDVDHVATAIVMQDNGQAARQLVERFRAARYFDVTHYVDSAAQAGDLIQNGTVKVAIVIPSDYSLRLDQGLVSQIQVLIDGSDPVISREALSTSLMLGQLVGNEILVTRMSRQLGMNQRPEQPVDVRSRIWYNPDMDSAKFNLPGVIGIVLQNITIVAIAGAMVREREHGTIEQLIVTPIKPAELIIGKMVPYIFTSTINSMIVLILSITVFGLKIAGSLAQLSLISFMFLLGSLGLGILFSAAASNQQQSTQVSLFFILPSVMLSGYFFPREAMPAALRFIGEFIPLTHYLIVLRGIVLKAMTIKDLWRQIMILAVYTVAMLAIASVRFRKRLD